MDWKNQLTKTPYLVLFIVLISVGVGTASALITITLSGNVIITDNLTVDGESTFKNNIKSERPSGNFANLIIQRPGGATVDNTQFVFTQRSDNQNLWLYGHDGSAFKNFIGFDFPNYQVSVPANGDTLVVDASASKVGIGTLNPDAALHVVEGGSDNTPNKQGIQLTGSDTGGNVGIELTGDDKMPYIDFQNDIDNTDFDARIILRGNDTLSVEGANLECPNCLLGFYQALSFEFADGGLLTIIPECDEGDIVTGGGYDASGGVETPERNHPFGSKSWRAEWFATNDGITYSAFAICADFPPAHVP